MENCAEVGNAINQIQSGKQNIKTIKKNVSRTQLVGIESHI